MSMHKTSAWPLALVYLCLIVYASLYPFAHWRNQGLAPWLLLLAPWPKYWTVFDVLINVLGYMPLGFLLVLGALRSGQHAYALRGSVLAASLLSMAMESLQVFLPDRVPSNLDLLLNVAGATLGAGSAWSLEKLGVLTRWNRFRSDWFIDDARGALVLLGLWPLALLFPLKLTFGLGQVLARLETTLAQALADSPFLPWLPVRDIELQPLMPITEGLCVMLGLLVACLLGYCIIAQTLKRFWFLLCLLAVGLAATTLSAALSFGPEHAWSWLTVPTKIALICACSAALGLLWLPCRAAAALATLVLGVYLSLINQSPTDPYFEQTLFLWEQGRFIRFHGLAQWLGWLWPYAALLYLLGILSDGKLKT